MKVFSKTLLIETFLLLVGLALAILVRLWLFPLLTADTQFFFIPWYQYIVQHGAWNSLADNFYTYNPPYIYLIDLGTFIKGIPPLYTIKLVSVIFDISSAFAVFTIVFKYYKNKKFAWLAFVTTLLLPTVFIESSFWGQCDVIYTSFLLWTIASLLDEKYTRGLIFFSVAFVFKSQSIFLAPLFLILLIKKKLPIFSLIWPFAIYFLSILPALLAGRSLVDLISIYLSQTHVYPSMSMNAPSLFYPLGAIGLYSENLVWIGLAIAACFVVIYLIFRFKNFNQHNSFFYLYDACYLTFLIPFFLPKMHERYFFPATLFFLLMLFLDRKTIWLATLVEISSLLSYINWLYALPVNLTEIAFWINIGLVLWIILWYGKKLTSPAVTPNTLEPQPNIRS